MIYTTILAILLVIITTVFLLRVRKLENQIENTNCDVLELGLSMLYTKNNLRVIKGKEPLLFVGQILTKQDIKQLLMKADKEERICGFNPFQKIMSDDIETLTVNEWAEKNSLLYRLADPDTREIQIKTDSGTETIKTILKYCIENKVEPITILCKDSETKNMFNELINSTIVNVIDINSPSKLAGRPIKVLIAYEADNYKNSETFNIAKRRTVTFHDSKIILMSLS